LWQALCTVTISRTITIDIYLGEATIPRSAQRDVDELITQEEFESVPDLGFARLILIPEDTKGTRRKINKAYEKLMHRASYLARTGRKEAARVVRKHAQQLPSQVPNDPDYRRLRFCRYADDFLLGFVGPKEEAEEIKHRLRTFLQEELTLELSEAKTLITHAKTETARFLNYEIHTIQED